MFLQLCAACLVFVLPVAGFESDMPETFRDRSVARRIAVLAAGEIKGSIVRKVVDPGFRLSEQQATDQESLDGMGVAVNKKKGIAVALHPLKGRVDAPVDPEEPGLTSYDLLSTLSNESFIDSGDCECESSISKHIEMVHGSNVAAQPSGDTVMFVHYHKTGCVLTRQLLTLFFNGKKTNAPLNKRAGGAGFSCPSLISQTQHRKFIQTAPDLNECAVGSTFPPATKVVHFLRDPYKMAVSGYLYHTQDPSPESWPNHKFQSCAVDGRQLKKMSQAFGLDIGPVRQLFETLNNPAASFYKNLRSLDRVQGLRLWTCFAICSDDRSAGGDFLRMPYNVQWLADSNMLVHNIYMDDWIAHTPTTFSSLHDFLGATSIPRDIDQIKRQAIFHPPTYSAHVTQGIVSQSEKDELIAALRADALLHPFLDLMDTAR